MGNPFPLIIATLLLLAASAQAQQSPTPPVQNRQSHDMSARIKLQLPADSLASILERCWGVEEIKSSHSTNFSSRNSDFDQAVGLFQGEVRRRWCHTSVEARGPVERLGKREYLARIDSLTLRLSTDTITAELHERAGELPRLTVNGRAASADWWLAGSRERVLRLARVPLP